MITVYKKKSISKNMSVEKLNDLFFNKYTAEMLDARAERIILKIDESKMIDQYSIASRFDGSKLKIDKLSTWCKTALNIMYNPDRIFDVSECGENALEVIYALKEGKIYCEYPMIAFNMNEVEAVDGAGRHVFTDYDELKEWWKNED